MKRERIINPILLKAIARQEQKDAAKNIPETHEDLASVLCGKKPARKKQGHGEDDLQMACAEYLNRQYPDMLWWHVPNGGRRDAREAARLIKMGVRPGCADLCFQFRHMSGYVELKWGKNGLTRSQEVFRDKVRGLGCLYEVARSLEEFMAILARWKKAGVFE